jgi:hypothetical protein
MNILSRYIDFFKSTKGNFYFYNKSKSDIYRGVAIVTKY